MKYLIVLITLSCLSLSTTAQAAFTDPSALLQTLEQSSGESRVLNLTMYGESAEGTLHITASGKMSGTTIADAKVDMSMTAKLYLKSEEMEFQLQSWIKFNKGQLYLRAQSDDAMVQSMLSELELNNRQWIYVPVQELLEMEGINMQEDIQQQMMKKIILKHVGKMFNMSHESLQNTDEYVLTLRPGFTEEILPLLQEVQAELGEDVITADEMPSQEELNELENMINSMTTVKARITMSKQDELVQARSYVKIHSDDEYNPGTAVIDSIIMASDSTVHVIVPADHLLVHINDLMGASEYTEYEAEMYTEPKTNEVLPLESEYENPSYQSLKPSRRQIKAETNNRYNR